MDCRLELVACFIDRGWKTRLTVHMLWMLERTPWVNRFGSGCVNAISMGETSEKKSTIWVWPVNPLEVAMSSVNTTFVANHNFGTRLRMSRSMGILWNFHVAWFHKFQIVSTGCKHHKFQDAFSKALLWLKAGRKTVQCNGAMMLWLGFFVGTQFGWLPSRELTYPTWGKGKASSNMPKITGIC